MIRKTLAAVLLVTAAAGAFAQPTLPRVDARQQAQDRRIDHGVASGALTTREAARLERGQTGIERMERRALADGTVTHRERARLHHAQDTQGARIFRQKHDRQHDFDRDGGVDRPRRP